MDCIQKIYILRVAFNNAYRHVFSLPWRSSASAMYANFGIQNFEAVIRKSTFRFIQRLAKSTNSLILWLLKVHGLYVLIYGTPGKKHGTLFQLHEFQLTDVFLKCSNNILTYCDILKYNLSLFLKLLY